MKFLILFIFSITCSYSFSEELILTPERNDVDLAMQLSKSSQVKSVIFLFSPSERTYLEQSGKKFIAKTLLVDVDSREDFLLEINHLKVNITKNYTLEPTSVSYYLEQWALNNRGVSQSIDITDIDSIRINSKIGEDINLEGVPEENSDNEIIVAILDTGIDYTHPDLKNVIFKNTSECRALLEYDKCRVEHTVLECDKLWASHDGDGNGYPLDCSGWNVLGNLNPQTGVKGNNDASDTIGHGTHLAGIIAAEDNGHGIKGLLKSVKILPVKVMGNIQNGAALGVVDSTLESDLPPVVSYADLFARGFLYAIRSGAHVINMSLGWSRDVDSHLMRQLVKLAHEQGISVIAAAGNDSTSSPIFPCLYDDVFCVGSYSSDGNVSHFSNFGQAVDIFAPGHFILSSWPQKLTPSIFTERKGYEFQNGTSMAAPYVSASVARLMNAGFSAKESQARLMAGARKTPVSSHVGDTLKYSLSGNLDLASAFNVKPNAFFVSPRKESHYSVWNGIDDFSEISLTLKNIWKETEKVSIDLSILNPLDKRVSLSQKTFEFGSLKNNDEIVLKLNFKGLRIDSPSEYVIKAEIKLDRGNIQTLFVKYELLIPLTSTRHHPLEIVAKFQNSVLSIGDKEEVRTFDNLYSDEKKVDLLLFKQDRFSSTFQLLSFNLETQVGKTNKKITIRSKPGEIIGLWSMDIDFDGVKDFVIAENVRESIRRDRRDPNTSSKVQGSFVRFHFFNHDFTNKNVELLGKNSNVIDFKSDIVKISKDFIWVKSGNMLVPTWLGKGELPLNMRDSFNPWLGEVDTKGLHLYYFGKMALRAIKSDKSFRFLDFVKSDHSHKKSMGVANLFTAKGEGFDYLFYNLEIHNLDAYNSSLKRELNFQSFFMLGGLESQKVVDLEGTNNSKSVFVDDGSHGGLKVGIVDLENQNVITDNVNSVSPFDPRHLIAGVFRLNEDHSYFSFGKYDILLHKNKKIQRTSMRRFSFLPGHYFDQFFYPVVLAGVNSSKEALYVPGALGVSLSSEVITSWDKERVKTLYRPAGFRVLATKGCIELNHLKRFSTKSALNFLCPDGLRIVPLEF